MITTKYDTLITLVANINDSLARINNIKGDFNYEYAIANPVNQITITHNGNKYPSVQMLDSANNQVDAIVHHIDKNNVSISFSPAFSGRVIFN